MVDIGNTTAFSYSAEEEKIELKQYRTAGGGNQNSITRVAAVNLSLDVSDFSGQNLAFGLFGSVSAVAAGTVTDEEQTTPADVSVDQLLPTDHVIDTDETVTVTGYTEGTDFTVRAAGIVVLASGTIPRCRNRGFGIWHDPRVDRVGYQLHQKGCGSGAGIRQRRTGS